MTLPPPSPDAPRIDPLIDPAVAPLPYYNLILTGSLGGRLLAVAREAARLADTTFFALDVELQTRAGRYADELRKLYGEAYVKRQESDIAREFALRRSAILVINPATLLDEETRARLMNVSSALFLTCSLGETLRRLHIQHGARFHEPNFRASLLYTIQRDGALLALPALNHVDTSMLTVEQTAAYALSYWKQSAAVPG